MSGPLLAAWATLMTERARAGFAPRLTVSVNRFEMACVWAEIDGSETAAGRVHLMSMIRGPVEVAFPAGRIRFVEELRDPPLMYAGPLPEEEPLAEDGLPYASAHDAPIMSEERQRWLEGGKTPTETMIGDAFRTMK